MLMGAFPTRVDKKAAEVEALLCGAKEGVFGRAVAEAAGYWAEGELDKCLATLLTQFTVREPRRAEEEKAVEIIMEDIFAHAEKAAEGFALIARTELSMWCAENVTLKRFLPHAALKGESGVALFFEREAVVVTVSGKSSALYDKVSYEEERGIVLVGKLEFPTDGEDEIMLGRLLKVIK